jgi:hypothetical protein
LAVRGSRRITAKDRFDPTNEEHQSFLRHYEEESRALAQKDLEAMRRIVHTQFRSIMRDINDPEQACFGNREGLIAPDSRDMSGLKTTIRYVKINGPVALVLKAIQWSTDGALGASSRSLAIFCREQNEWKVCLWVARDWERLLVEEYWERRLVEEYQQ